MKSRSGLWILSICVVSLAGCTNMQNRLGNRTSGSAASLSSAPANGPLLGTTGSTFGEPPPPMPPPPSDPGATLGPIGGPSPQKLDLSAVPGPSGMPSASGTGRRPDSMYNLGAPESSSAKAADNAPRKSSAISKLASKASPSKSLDELPKPKANAVTRLSADANASSSKKPETTDSAEVSAPSEKAEAPAAAKAKTETSAEIMDTTLLAQPVRKGSSGKDDKESKGPQSRLMPGVKLFNKMNKPTIYPVSNPVSEEPVSLIKFS